MHGIDVVVVNYRTSGDLTNFLHSLPAATTIPADLWVVNNDPLPEDIDAAWEGTFSPRRVFDSHENLGYARAVNHAAAQGQHDTIGIFNADVVLQPTSVDRCVAKLWSDASWGVLGPRQVDTRGRLIHAGIFGPDVSPKHRGWKERDNDKYSDVRDDAYSVSGSAYFVKRHAWNELTECPIYRAAHPDAEGAFLPTFLMYEETWCSCHARAHGWKVVYCGDVSIIHKFHGSIREHGGDEHMRPSRTMFREMCQRHDMEHN